MKSPNKRMERSIMGDKATHPGKHIWVYNTTPWKSSDGQRGEKNEKIASGEKVPYFSMNGER